MASDTFIQVFNKVEYKFILCLTGTLERLDMRHLLLEKYAPVCDRITLEEAERNGWVAPHKEYVVMLNVDLLEYNEANARFNKAFAFFDYDFASGMAAATDFRVRNRIAKEKRVEAKVVTAMAMEFVRNLRKRKDFIANHPKKLEICRRIIEARKDKKILTFSGTIKQSEAIGVGYTLHSKKSKKQNQEVIEKFNNDPCGVLNTNRACDEGKFYKNFISIYLEVLNVFRKFVIRVQTN